MKFSTKAIHVGQQPDPSTGAIIPPIYQTSTYVHEGIENYGAKGYKYARGQNPTRSALEECLASLENGKHGLAFASGSAATTAVLGLLSQGDHIVFGEDVYGGTYRLFNEFKRYGITFTTVDSQNAANTEAAVQPNTKLIWLETPTNPLLRLADIEAHVQLAKSKKVLLAVDNTFASPYLQNPLDMGVDLVVHSTTKYLGGHSDVVGGAVITNRDDLHTQLRFHQNAIGAIPGPFDVWLVMRGVKTLEVRMLKHCSNAVQIAKFLSEHKAVEKVYYPGLPDHPQHALAKRQMRGFGGMVSLVVKGGTDGAKRFMNSTKLFSLAESLGGVESLIGHPVTMTHGPIPKAEREARGIFDGLVRLSVGIEDADDLVADLSAALAQVQEKALAK